jgi:large conductance mechanosensitive channel
MNTIDRIVELQPTKKVFSLFEEFKNFAFKGNVIDLAVGVIIGAAFAKVISSLVEDLMMPLIGVIVPGGGYDKWVWTIEGKDIPFGKFLAAFVNLFIVSLVLFVFIYKFLGWIMKQKKQEAVAPPPLTKDQELLTEIRDLLKKGAAPAPQS